MVLLVPISHNITWNGDNNNHHGPLFLVHAACVVRDKKGTELGLLTLPHGIQYHAASDHLECYQPSSCREFVITGCAHVECKHEYACRGAQLSHNQRVSCAWLGACQDATIEHSEQVTCGAGAANSDKYCYKATLHQIDQVWCHGPRSCAYATDQQQDYTTIKVWDSGKIRCENLVTREYACQRLAVYVRFEHQACIDYGKALNRACPIVCVNPWDCDKNSFYFLPQEEE
ncbi:hypothetical protein ACA910_011201 [Epithemia clementina (nom. ined.)]